MPVCTFLHVFVFWFWRERKGSGSLSLPESTETEEAMTRVTGSLWPHFGTGVACALTSKLLHIFPPQKQPESPHTYISCFPGGDLFSSINHLIKLGFIFILVLYVMLLLVHEHFQQLFMTFHHCTSHFLGAFSHLVTEASCLPMQSECS